MTAMGRRLQRLEHAQPQLSRWDAMEPVLAAMSTPDLILLVHHGNAVREGRRPTDEEEAVSRRFWDRLARVGIIVR